MTSIRKVVLLLFLFPLLSFSFEEKNVEAPQITVHVIAHTHDDVGWLKTVDEYYYGANSSIQNAGVQYILDTVIDALLDDPMKKFIYVEIAFFMRWWREQSEFKKQIVRDLVSSRRLEFINGGWCMNDEATTHYAAVIEQMTEGHDFLFREFGVRPRIGWHIDPFGHSATQASLFAQMGFDAFFFGRIDFGEHMDRNASKELEFVWRGSQSLGKATEIWTHVLYTDYCFLDGFAWDYGAEPIQDDPDLFDPNIKQKAESWARQIRERAAGYRTTNIVAPFGCDFAFQNAHLNFKNMDKLMAYINSHPEYGMKLIYSTPSIYMEAVHSTGLTWSVKTGDFFPYADDSHSYWTGFYTSRSALKGYVRQQNGFLHAADKLLATSNVHVVQTRHNLEKLDILTQAFGVAQHHDAVSGTEQQHVAYDYAKRLSIGQTQAQSVMSEVLGHLVAAGGAPPKFTFCPLINESICPSVDILSQGQAVPIIVYNSIAWKRTEYLRIPIPVANVKVLNSNGAQVASQIIPNMDRKGYYTIIFAVDLPPMGFSTYYLSTSGQEQKVTPISVGALNPILENPYYKVIFDGNTGRMKSILNKQTSQTIQITQDYLWWNASTGNNNLSHQASGAYIFRPNGTVPFAINKGNVAVSIVNGSLVQEVYQVFNPWVKQVVRLYKQQNYVEVEATIGPIDISDGLGKEIISRYYTDIANNGVFYTDSQGMEFQKRIKNYRPWKNFNLTEPIASNYYPMNAAAYIADSKNQLTLVTDRSRGASSLQNGQYENMVHRRLLVDDGRGVGEPLNESNIVRTTELLIVESPSMSARHHRQLALRLANPPVLAFGQSSTVHEWRSKYKPSFTPMNTALPPNVHLLNFKIRFDGTFLVRLTHLYAVGEDHEFSRPATIDISNLFPGLQIIEAVELTLSGNQPKSELHRLVWKTADEEPLNENLKSTPLSRDTVVVMNPMDTRTFGIRYQPNN